jgi:hypothetical protein
MVDYTKPGWAQQLELRKRRRQPTKPKRQRRRWQTYGKAGMTLLQIQSLHRAQSGKCANEACRASISIVGKSRAVDHDPQTGEVRGMLCRNCSQALALLYSDTRKLAGLVEYLARCDNLPHRQS